MTDPKPGPQQLSGYVMRDYDELIATLARSRESQGISLRLVAAKARHSDVPVGKWLSGKSWALGPNPFDLADALGYDLAIVPRSADRSAP